ncbi:MAG: EamA family transporter [Candidatus Omnitrophica bacterium]|nr:EamA family transporter [Candidatus Omnitrophota bacterium]
MGIAIALAFLMTLITASSNIVLKKGLHKIHPFTATYLSVAISTLFLWLITSAYAPRSSFSNTSGILIFVLIGTFAPTIVRTLTYYGIHTLGAGRSAPIRALTPFFATFMAIVFLKERPRIGIFLGISLIVAGVALLSRKNQNDTAAWKPKHLLYPLGAAVLAGCAANLRKFGLDIMPDPVFASTIAASSSLVIMSCYAFTKHRREIAEIKHHGHELRFIVIAAFLTTIGEIVDLSALMYGKVSLVVPIFAVTPLSILFLSHIFLKKHERVTKEIVLAALIIILGIAIAIRNVS